MEVNTEQGARMDISDPSSVQVGPVRRFSIDRTIDSRSCSRQACLNGTESEINSADTSDRAPAATGLPGDRLPMLKFLLSTLGRPLRVLETHSGLTGLIAEHAQAVGPSGDVVSFDGMWSSSLTASALKGKPDIEVVDVESRSQIVRDTLNVTTLPMIYDADTGGQAELFKFTVRQLEEMGVSACIIEDKCGLKQNSLFGTEREQTLEDIPSFCNKIAAGRAARVRP